MNETEYICDYLGTIEEGCPIPQAHGRLLEAHILWHSLVRQYQNPVIFSTYLNTTIQALRNITFILQSEKKVIPDFNKWYSKWQDKMRGDRLLRWLHQARNVVVKQGDLDKESIALVSLKNWFDYPLWALSVPPSLPTDELTHYIGEKLGPIPEEWGELVLSVERRWIIPDLPEYEITDILATGFGFLNNLIISAHSICDIKLKYSIDNISGRPPCMIALHGTRSAYYHISDKTVFSVKLVDDLSEPVPKAKVIERYGEDNISSLAKGEKDIYKIAESCVEMGKIILKKDKHHSGMVFIYKPDGSVKACQCNPPDRETKFIMIREIANLIEQIGATGVILINEVWLFPMEGYDGGNISKHIAQLQKKEEALAVHVVTKEGPFREYLTPFKRDNDGNILFDKTVVEEGGQSYFLKPIFDVWKK